MKRKLLSGPEWLLVRKQRLKKTSKAKVDLEKKTAMVGSESLEKKADAKTKSTTFRKGERKPPTN